MRYCSPITDQQRNEIKECYQGRRVKIEEDEDLIVVTYKAPCLVCNRVHRLGSKASQKCAIIILGLVGNVVYGDNECLCD